MIDARAKEGIRWFILVLMLMVLLHLPSYLLFFITCNMITCTTVLKKGAPFLNTGPEPDMFL